MESFQSTVSIAANLFALITPGLILYFAKKQKQKAAKNPNKTKPSRK